MAILREYRGMYPKIGNNVFLAEDVVLIGDVTVADGASIWWGSVLRGDCGAIVVGENSNIQEGSMLHSTTDISTTVLGPRVTVGHHALIHGASIAEGVLVGMKSVILDLATIGEFSIVAAGSVVPERMEVPAFQLVAGVPARFKKELDPVARKVQQTSSFEEYCELAAWYREHVSGE